MQKEIDKKGGEQYGRISDFSCFHSQDQIGKDKRRIIKKHIQYISPNSENHNQKMKIPGINDFSTEDIICHILPSDKRKECWLEYCSQPIKSGRYIGGKIEQYIDITAYKKTEKRSSEYVKELEIISEKE